MRRSVIRIERCRAPERVYGALSIRRRLAEVVHALEVGVVGCRNGLPRVGSDRRASVGVTTASHPWQSPRQFRVQRRGVAERSFELLRPDLRVGASGYQSRVDADAILAAILSRNHQDRRLDDVIDAKRLRRCR